MFKISHDPGHVPEKTYLPGQVVYGSVMVTVEPVGPRAVPAGKLAFVTEIGVVVFGYRTPLAHYAFDSEAMIYTRLRRLRPGESFTITGTEG